MSYVAKAALRQAKNYTKGYTDIQVKVREATSNDPWGPSGGQMAEIAEASFNAHEFMDIMDLIDRRLNDSGKMWRHVFKALTLLDYLIHCGSEQVVAYAKQNLYVIRTLKEFQFIDEEGKDQGSNVREKSKAIAALLADDERLREARKTRAQLRDRMNVGSSSVASPYSSTSQSGFDSAYQSGGGGGQQQRPAFAPSSAYEEEKQLERAIEESKRLADLEARRRRDMQNSIEDSASAFGSSNQQQQLQVQQRTQPETQAIDLWGTNDQRNHDMDFFTSTGTPAPAQQHQPDPFGLAAAPHSQPQRMIEPDLFSIGTSQTQLPQQQIAFPQQQQSIQQQSNPFGFQQQPSFNQFAQAPVQQQVQQSQPQQIGFGGNANSGAMFDAAFDTGAGQKNLVPRYVQGQTNNPNAQLAQIARNATNIDQFASLASKSNPGSLTDLSFGGPSGNAAVNRGGPAFSTMQPMRANSGAPYNNQQPQQQQSMYQQPQSVFPDASKPAGAPAPKFAGGNDPFASLSPFPSKQATGGVSAGMKPMGAPLGGSSANPSLMGSASGFGGNSGFASNPFGQQQAGGMQPQQSFGQQQPQQQQFNNAFPQQQQQFNQRPPQQQQSQNDFFF